MNCTCTTMVFCVLVSSWVCAGNYTWNGVSGSFQSDSNWTPIGIPSAADNAKFTTAGTYGVVFNADAANASAAVGADVTFDLNGHTWQLTNNIAFESTGIARVVGGVLEVGYPRQPYSGPSVTVGANRKLVLNSGTSRFMGPVSLESKGAIEVNGGDHSLSWSMTLRQPPSGGASFRMTDGYFRMTNNDNYARCSLSTGSLMSLEGGTLDVRYQVDINGTGSDPAVINIYTNATLLQNPGIGFNVSRTSGGLGIVNILGGSLLLPGINCSVVNVSGSTSMTTGIINLVDGQLVAGNLGMGSTSNSVAIVRQTGGQLKIDNICNIGQENNTTGYLIQEGGRSWFSTCYLGAFAASGSVGEVSLSGGIMAVAGSSSAVGKYAGSTGRLLQSGGELIISNSFPVGNAAGAYGVITNTGGRFWLNGDLNLGSSGSGAFGRAYFSGPSNYVKSAINVGNSASDLGELVVGGGALVCDGAIVIGNAAGSTGMTRIVGGTTLCKGISVGRSGEGTLSISGGSLTNSASFNVGDLAGSQGSIEISGGTNLFMGSGLNIGSLGTGSMRITGGYTYTEGRVVVGHSLGSTGRLELVDGVFSVPIIDGRSGSQYTPPGGYSEVLFDGGTLQHSVDGEEWMPGNIVNSFNKATLTDRGAVIDSKGDTIGIGQALSNEVGFAGSFTKKGAGKLTLTSLANAFTGRVTVEEGELAVTGAIYLTGGVAVGSGAFMNLASAIAVRDSTTSAGTCSQIDGALALKSGVTLIIGEDASLGGSGVVTGNVEFAAGSRYERDKDDAAGALQVAGNIVIQNSTSIVLTGYTADDLLAGIPLLTALSTGTLQVQGKLPVTLTARLIYQGTLITVR